MYHKLDSCSSVEDLIFVSTSIGFILFNPLICMVQLTGLKTECVLIAKARKLALYCYMAG